MKKGTCQGLYDIIEVPTSVGEGKVSKCLRVVLQMHFSIISVCFIVRTQRRQTESLESVQKQTKKVNAHRE